jgi:hypothetical protein
LVDVLLALVEVAAALCICNVLSELSQDSREYADIVTINDNTMLDIAMTLNDKILLDIVLNKSGPFILIFFLVYLHDDRNIISDSAFDVYCQAFFY